MDDLLQAIAREARQALIDEPEAIAALPVVFSISDELGLFPVPVPPFDGEKEKLMSFGTAVALARALGGKRLTVLTDAWYVEVEEDEDLPGVPPSERLDRMEELVLTDSTELGVSVYTLKYTRDDEGRPQPKEWGEAEKNVDGILVSLLEHFTQVEDPPAPVHEGAQQMVQRWLSGGDWEEDLEIIKTLLYEEGTIDRIFP